MNLTDSQRAAIEHRGSDLLLAASAGSGKTEVLARRCVGLICDAERPCGVDRLLVVTFTRAAASELRQRIARELLRAARETRDPRVRRHLLEQLPLVDGADIGTIDAWCARVLRANFAEACVDAAFRVLAPEEAAVLRGRVLRDTFAEMYRGPDALSAAGRAWVSRATSPSDDFLRNMVARLNQFREHLLDPETWLARRRVETEGAPAELQARASQRLAPELARECLFQSGELGAQRARDATACGLNWLREYVANLDHWATQLKDPGRFLDVIAQIAGLDKSKPRGLSPAAGDMFEEIRKRYYEKRLAERWDLDEIAGAFKHIELTAGWLRTLLDLEARFEARLRAEKNRLAALEFGDVLRATLDLLGTATGTDERRPTSTAERLRARYEHVLVDEYQDTSPVQAEIVRLVSRAGAQANRFMVGDLKQSIYGFRQAEPRKVAVLMQRMTAGLGAGRVAYLSDNFRSHTEVLDPLNALFANLFSAELGGVGYVAEEHLRATRAEIANRSFETPRIEAHLIDPGERVAVQETDEFEDEIVQLERIEREAILVVQRIRELMESGIETPEKTPEGGLRLRRLRYSDIVILLRAARGHAPAVAGILRSAGIPCATGGRDELLASVEVNDVLNVLTLLSNRRQALPLAAYLRGPFAQLSAENLLAIRQAARLRDFASAVQWYVHSGPDDGLRQRVCAALERLDAWAVIERESDLPALLRLIFNETGFLLFVEGLRGGAHRVSLLHALLELARSFAAQGGHGAGEFARYLEELRGQESSPQVSGAAGEDVVRVLTIHGAKGLEFPIVFLLNLGARFNRRAASEPLQCAPELGLAVKFADAPTRAQRVSPLYPLIRHARGERDLEEELRLLYVATTRAREKLVLVGHCKPETWESLRTRHEACAGRLPLLARLNAGCLLEWVLMSMAAAKLHAPPGNAAPAITLNCHLAEDFAAPIATGPGSEAATPLPQAHEVTDDDLHWLRMATTAIRQEIAMTGAAWPAVLSVSALKNLSQRGADGVQLGDVQHAALLRPAFAQAATAAVTGVDIGIALHAFMQHADLARMATTRDVRRQIAQLLAQGRLTAVQAEQMPVEDVAWLGATPEWPKLVRDSARLRRETPFVFAAGLAEGERMLVRGVIDLLIDDGKSLLLMDYKSDQPRDQADFDSRIAIYGLQLQLYAQAAAAIYQKPVRRAVLAFVRARQMVDVPLGTPDIAEMLRAGSAAREEG